MVKTVIPKILFIGSIFTSSLMASVKSTTEVPPSNTIATNGTTNNTTTTILKPTNESELQINWFDQQQTQELLTHNMQSEQHFHQQVFDFLNENILIEQNCNRQIHSLQQYIQMQKNYNQNTQQLLKQTLHSEQHFQNQAQQVLTKNLKILQQCGIGMAMESIEQNLQLERVNHQQIHQLLQHGQHIERNFHSEVQHLLRQTNSNTRRQCNRQTYRMHKQYQKVVHNYHRQGELIFKNHIKIENKMHKGISKLMRRNLEMQGMCDPQAQPKARGRIYVEWTF